MDKGKREVLRVVSECGFRLLNDEKNGAGHHNLKLAKNGRTYLIVAPRKLETDRALLNWRAQLRRMEKEDLERLRLHSSSAKGAAPAPKKAPDRKRDVDHPVPAVPVGGDADRVDQHQALPVAPEFPSPDLPNEGKIMIESKVETITTKTAKLYLASWGGNRKLSQDIVTRYASSIKKGEWQLNGEPIIFDRHGKMIDGQHRCHGIVMADTAIKTLVVRGVQFESFETLDSGKARSVGDVLSIAEIPNSNSVAAAARIMMQLECLGCVSEDRALRPTKSELLDYVKKNNQWLQTGYKRSINARASVLLGTGLPTAMYALACRAGLGDEAERFMIELGKGLFSTDDPTHHPTYQLRQRLIANKTSRVRAQLPVLAAMTIKAWNAWLGRKKLQLVRFNTNEAFPVMNLKAGK